tara:strand:- start:455 stop:3040 length:2586 start_codon:yes stop_codon:yes gene_type:complete
MVDKNIFLEEIDDLQKKKEERIEELQQFKTEETPNVFSLLMDSFVQSPTSSIIKAAERDESFFNAKEMKEIFSQRKGIEKYGLNRETFEAVGGISGLAVATRALTLRALPYVPSVPGKILSLILYDALGATAGAQAFDLIQSQSTGEEMSLWEQLEVLPEDFKTGLTWASIGPMAESAIQAFRVLLSSGVIKDKSLVEAFNKSKEYLGDRLAFTIGDLDTTTGVGKFINVARMGFAQIPFLGTKLKGATAERATKLFDLLGDFSNKMGKGLDDDTLARKIFEQSNKAYGVFKKTMGRISDEIVKAEKLVPNKGKVIPVNNMRNFLTEYIDDFEKTYGKSVAKTNDPGYNEFYTFAKRFISLYPENARINYTGWKAVMEQLENAVKNSRGKPGTSKQKLGSSFDEMRKLLSDANADDFLAKFSKGDQSLIKNYIQQIQDFRQIYSTAREPFERVVAGEIEKVDDIFTALSGKFKGESKKYVDELVAPLLRRMSPSAVEDLIKITGGDRKLAGELVRTWFDDAFASSTRNIKESGMDVLDTGTLLKKLGLDGSGGKVKGKAFNQLVDLVNESLPTSQRLPNDYVADLISMLTRQQNINIPATATFLRRSIAIGGMGGSRAITNNPIAKIAKVVLGGPLGVVGSIIGVRSFSNFLTSPETLKFAIQGFDSTLPAIQRKTAYVQFFRALKGDLEQRAKDAAINTELQALDPSFNPDIVKEAQEKIDGLLDNIQLFEKDPSKTDQLDQIIKEVDTFQGDSNIFLDELDNLQESTEDTLPSTTLPSGGSVIFSEPQVQRGDTGSEVIEPLSVPQLNLASISGEIGGSPNPQTMSGLESVGLPLFNAADGGIVDLYESKKFKRPQVVA